MTTTVPQKILIIRADYYKDIVHELTCGALLALCESFGDSFSSVHKNIKYLAMQSNSTELNFWDRNFIFKLNYQDFRTLPEDIEKLGVDISTTNGCLEIPQIISKIHDKYNIIIALGCVIRGETTHYETVCNETNRAIMDLSISSNCVITNAIINAENYHQAKARSGFWLKDHQNKGGVAVKSALQVFNEIARLKRKFNKEI